MALPAELGILPFARFYEADVTAVCSTTNLKWVGYLGANTMIDYTKEYFTRNGEKIRHYFGCRGNPYIFQMQRFINSKRRLHYRESIKTSVPSISNIVLIHNRRQKESLTCPCQMIKTWLFLMGIDRAWAMPDALKRSILWIGSWTLIGMSRMGIHRERL